MQGECDVRLHELQVTSDTERLNEAARRLALAWIDCFPHTTRAGRHAVATRLQMFLEELSQDDPQEELCLLGGSYRGERP